MSLDLLLHGGRDGRTAASPFSCAAGSGGLGRWDEIVRFGQTPARKAETARTSAGRRRLADVGAGLRRRWDGTQTPCQAPAAQ